MNELCTGIEELRSEIPIEYDAPLTAITGLSTSTAERYADPDASPDAYYGRNTVVETVGELICSDATIKAVPSQYRWPAIRELLAVQVTTEDVSETIETRSDTSGGLSRLFGESVDTFDPTAVTVDDLRLARFYTAFGTSVAMGERPRHIPLSRASETNWVEAVYWLRQHCWRQGQHRYGVDTTAMQEVNAISPVMEMHRRDEVVLTDGTDPVTLTTTERVKETAVTALPANGIVAASLLLGANFADVDTEGTVFIRGYDDSELPQGTPYCVFVPPDGDVRCGMAGHPDRLPPANVSKAVRDYLV